MSKHRHLSKLISSFPLLNTNFNIKVFLSYDILSAAPLDYYDFLVNPANEALCGPAQTYFPVGGPVPAVVRLKKDGRSNSSSNNNAATAAVAMKSSNWKGMEKGDNMMYAVQVLDGCVHAECGAKLQEYLQSLPDQSPFVDYAGQAIKCPVGKAVVSPSFGSLAPYFGKIIHTVAPFQNDAGWEKSLINCYLNSFRHAWINNDISTVKMETFDQTKSISAASKKSYMATTLIGAGCRGIRLENAVRVAAEACVLFSKELELELELARKFDVDRRVRSDVVGKETEDDDDVVVVQQSCELHFVLREENDCQLLTDHLQKASS